MIILRKCKKNFCNSSIHHIWKRFLCVSYITRCIKANRHWLTACLLPEHIFLQELRNLAKLYGTACLPYQHRHTALEFWCKKELSYTLLSKTTTTDCRKDCTECSERKVRIICTFLFRRSTWKWTWRTAYKIYDRTHRYKIDYHRHTSKGAWNGRGSAITATQMIMRLSRDLKSLQTVTEYVCYLFTIHASKTPMISLIWFRVQTDCLCRRRLYFTERKAYK